MLIEAGTIDELQVALQDLWPGRKAGVRQDVFTNLFAVTTLAIQRDSPLWQFGRRVQCSLQHDPDAGTVWFEKWLPPDAA